MKRRLLNLLTALSLLLCVAACVLWGRSYAADDVLWGDKATAVVPPAVDRRMFTAESGRGGLLLHTGRIITADPRIFAGPPTGRWVMQMRCAPLTSVPPRQTRHQWLGFAFDRRHFKDALTANSSVIAVIPYWFIALGAAVLPAVYLRRRSSARRRLRASRGQCLRCGYDLRASPDLCPECGAIGGTGGCAANA